MKGVVIREFIDLVEARYGEDVVDRLLSHPGLSTGGAYTAVGTYDHTELLTLIELLSQEIGVEPHELTIELGKQLFNRLYKSYPQFVDPHDNAFDFLKTIDSVVHTEVKKLYSDAEVPDYHCEQLNDRVLEQHGLQAAVFGQDSACHRRFRTEASDWNSGFRRGALHSCSESSAVEPGGGQMGSVGLGVPL